MLHYQSLTTSYAKIAVLCVNLKDYTRALSREQLDKLTVSGAALVKGIIVNNLSQSSSTITPTQVLPSEAPAKVTEHKPLATPTSRP